MVARESPDSTEWNEWWSYAGSDSSGSSVNQAFGRFFDTTVDDLTRYAMSLARNRSDAKDLVIAAYHAACEELPCERWTKESFAWLRRTVKNKAHELWRDLSKFDAMPEDVDRVEDKASSQSQGTVGDDSSPPIIPEGPDGIVHETGLSDPQFLWALQSLPDDQRKVFIRRTFFQGETTSYKNIADGIGQTESYARGLFRRAKIKLQALLASRNSDDEK